MYLNHHYAVDLVGGSLIAVSIYSIARARYLPRQQADKKNRWAYDYIEVGEKPRNRGEEYGILGTKEEGYGLGMLEQRSSTFGDEDQWTLGSSSSFSVSSTPRTSTTSPTLLSPSTPDDSFREHVSIPMNMNGQLVWDERERESELSEVVVVR